MKVYKETSELFQKVEKLCAYADELGITLNFNRYNVSVSDNSSGNEAILLDKESLSDVSQFPPFAQYVLKASE